MLVMMTSVLHVTKTLSDQLQSADLDLSSAIDLIESVKSSLISKRNLIEFNVFWTEANGIWSEIEHTQTKRARRKRKTTKSLMDFLVDSTIGASDEINCESDFCERVYYDVIDNLLQELNKKFSETSCSLMKGIQALNPSSDNFLISKI